METRTFIKVIRFFEGWVLDVIFSLYINSFKSQPLKMVKHTETIYRLLPTNCLSVIDHYVGLPLKGLITLV